MRALSSHDTNFTGPLPIGLLPNSSGFWVKNTSGSGMKAL